MTTSSTRIGLIGAGGISHAHLPHLLSLGAEVHVYAEAGAPELVARYGGSVARSLDDLLDAVDHVDVATPTPTHFPLAMRALGAGKDVVIEKPLARTSAEARELMVMAERSGRQLYPGHVVRYFPEYARATDAVRAGLIGDPVVLRFARSGAFPTHAPWFADPALSGGIVMDQMIHDLDMARVLAGEVVNVSAISNRSDDHGHPVEAAHVLVTHASGAISHVAGVWGPPHLRFTTEYSVTGTTGSLEHSSAAEVAFATDLADSARGGELLPATSESENPFHLELRDVLAAFAGGPPPRATSADGLEAIRIAEAALASIATGQPVELIPSDEIAVGAVR